MRSVSLGYLLLFMTGLGAFAASMYILSTSSRPLLAFAPPLALPFFFLIFRSPRYGYYLMIVLIPLSAWQGLLQKYKFLTISKFVGICILFSCGALMVMRRGLAARLRSDIWYPMGLFLLVCTISMLLSHHPAKGVTVIRRMGIAYIFSGFTLLFIRRRELQTVIPALLIGSTGLAAVTATMGKIFNLKGAIIAVEAQNIAARAVGATSNPNFFAASITISLPLIAYYLTTRSSWRWRVPMGLLFINNCYAVFISYSRSQILVLLIVLFLLAIKHLKRIRPRHMGFVFTALLLVAAVGIYKLPETSVWKRIMTLAQPGVDRSLQRRGSYYFVAMDSLKQDFLLGAGPGTFTALYEDSIFSMAFSEDGAEFARSAHNTYLEVLTETGILGLGCLLWTLGLSLWTFFSAVRAGPDDRNPDGAFIKSIGYSMAAFMMSAFFFSNLQHKYIWMFVGLAMVTRRIFFEADAAQSAEPMWGEISDVRQY